MIINFKEVKIKDLEGKEFFLDMSKNFANFLYQTTGDLGMLEIAQAVYKEGELEVNKEVKRELITILENPNCPFIAVAKKALLDQLKEKEHKPPCIKNTGL